MPDFPVTWLEVFAEQPLGGNLHIVVQDADAVDPATMAAFAKRVRLSETSFVQSASAPGADYRHRIFTVAQELPFAGHPSLGTATAVALRRGSARSELVQETGAGLQPLEVELSSDGRTATAEIEQNPPLLAREPDPVPLLLALGLSYDDRHPSLPAAVISTGLPTLVLPVRDRAALAAVEVSLPRLAGELAAAGAVTCYVVVPPLGDDSSTGIAGGGRWRARCFTDQVAGGEDAATGSAAGPLTAFAHRYLGLQKVEVDQGIELGSPSRLWGRTEGDCVIVGGHVRVVGTGTMDLPASAASAP